MNHKNNSPKTLLKKVSIIGERLNVPTYIAYQVFYGYVVTERDKPEVHKILTGLSLEG